MIREVLVIINLNRLRRSPRSDEPWRTGMSLTLTEGHTPLLSRDHRRFLHCAEALAAPRDR
ncbi:MAG: hypothetical protein ACRDS0_41710 [Pseudonocardiaceae bacterium]